MKDIHKVALVFDDRTRPETTGVYCRRALESLVEVQFFHPEKLTEIPRHGFDLYLNIDDGLDYAWPEDLHPSAFWAIDTHLDFPRSVRRAGAFDVVFAAQRDGAALLRQAGIESARWLPLACDPQIHGRQTVPVQYDVAFVGNVFPGPREDLLRRVRQNFRQTFVGRAYFEAMARIYSASRTVLNRSVRSDINMRVFEAACSGSLLLTNDLADNGQAELFRDRVHLVTYQDSEELVDKLRYYLRNKRLRKQIAAAGRQEVLEKHTYRHRMIEILKTVVSVGNALRGVPLSAECGARNAEPRRVGQVKRVPPSPDKSPCWQCEPETVGLASSAHPTGQSNDAPFGDARNGTESVPYRPTNFMMPISSAAVCGDTRSGTESVPYRRDGLGSPSYVSDGLGSPSYVSDGLGSPSYGAAERHRGRSLQNLNVRAKHDAGYFDFARPELLALVPQSARRILEIGCGAGRLGEALKARQPCQVVGVELDPQAAATAAGRLDGVLNCDVEASGLDFPPDDFDVVVCGDILEHLCDPQRLLVRAARWLKRDGLLVASIPNVRHHSVVRSLIEGNFCYEPAGLLDSTHLRFFARRDIEQLLDESGYEARGWQAVAGPGFDEWQSGGRPGSVDLGRFRLDGLATEEAQEFFVYQWLVTAAPKRDGRWRSEAELPCREGTRTRSASEAERAAASLALRVGVGERYEAPAPAAEAERASSSLTRRVGVGEHQVGPVIATKGAAHQAKLPACLVLMVTYNRFDYTRVALEAALAQEYPGPWQLVVWDNGSTDRTLDHLRERLRGIDHARLIESRDNRGVVYPMNEVWGAAGDAELLAKIDNDTWAPSDLVRRLAECHLASSAFGVLSGFHFRKEGEALADESRIRDIGGVSVLPQPYVGGCAVMLRRAVFDELGKIPCRRDAQAKPFMDSGWTYYQQHMHERGLVNGYPWPPIHVDHMEDVRSPRCVRTAEHQEYKQELRGMSLEEFTERLCVWRPNWLPMPAADARAW